MNVLCKTETQTAKLTSNPNYITLTPTLILTLTLTPTLTLTADASFALGWDRGWVVPLLLQCWLQHP